MLPEILRIRTTLKFYKIFFTLLFIRNEYNANCYATIHVKNGRQKIYDNFFFLSKLCFMCQRYVLYIIRGFLSFQRTATSRGRAMFYIVWYRERNETEKKKEKIKYNLAFEANKQYFYNNQMFLTLNITFFHRNIEIFANRFICSFFSIYHWKLYAGRWNKLLLFAEIWHRVLEYKIYTWLIYFWFHLYLKFSSF